MEIKTFLLMEVLVVEKIKRIVHIPFLFIIFISSVGAYVSDGGDCTCSTCDDCESALNDNVNCTNIIYLTTDTEQNGTCIDNPTNFNNKTFDCQNHLVTGNTSGYGILMSGDNNIVRNCKFHYFEYGISDPSFISGLEVEDNTTDPLLWGVQEGEGLLLNLTSNDSFINIDNSADIALSGNITFLNTSYLFCDNIAPVPNASGIKLYDPNGTLRLEINENTTNHYDPNGTLRLEINGLETKIYDTTGKLMAIYGENAFGNRYLLNDTESMHNEYINNFSRNTQRNHNSGGNASAAFTVQNDIGYGCSLIIGSSNYNLSGPEQENAGGVGCGTPGAIGMSNGVRGKGWGVSMWLGEGFSRQNHTLLISVTPENGTRIPYKDLNVTNGSAFVSDNITAQNFLGNVPDYVPYVNATDNVDLGNHTLTAQKLYATSDNVPVTSKTVANTPTTGATTNVYTDIDLTNYYDSSYTAFEGCVMGTKNNTELTFAKLNTQFDNIIVVGEVGVIGISWYDNTTATVNVTSQFNSQSDNIELFHAQGSIVYIGGDDNFTEIGVSLSTGASKNIEPTFHYCNSSGGWQTISVTDTTLGFRQSGTISFINPPNRGKCNEEMDGTPFSDATNYSYFAVNRTLDDGKLAIKPVENIVSVSGGGVQSMILTKDLLMLSPVSTPPEICTITYKGAMYNDDDLNLPCYCNGVNWVQMDDFTTTCS